LHGLSIDPQAVALVARDQQVAVLLEDKLPVLNRDVGAGAPKASSHAAPAEADHLPLEGDGASP